ncbi:MAG TPA: hypothetical protein ENK62_09375 [Chromatiales bacterium]|nr:hypothetical protein [Chromatiales bacterium]
MQDAAAWIEAYSIECSRYRARISPRACRQHQVVDPEACRGCPRATETDPGRGMDERYGRARGGEA